MTGVDTKSSSSFSAPVIDSSIEQVDVALYNAMTNPRERMAVLQMENSILNFVKTRFGLVLAMFAKHQSISFLQYGAIDGHSSSVQFISQITGISCGSALWFAAHAIRLCQ